MPGVLVRGNARAIALRDGSVQCVVTSPPYWGLRDYQVAGQIGLERTPEEYVATIGEVFREVRRVLKDDGTLWLNLGDSFANDGKWGGETGGKQAYLPDNDRKRCGREKRLTGLKPKDLLGMPWRVAFALQADGWWLRSDIIWSKPNPMPESVTDRPTRSHEYIFLLTKSERYYYDARAIIEPASESTHARIAQPRVLSQAGGDKDYGGNRSARLTLTHYAEKALAKPPGPNSRINRSLDPSHEHEQNGKPRKQDGHGRRHAGFNERWDESERCAAAANPKSLLGVQGIERQNAGFQRAVADLVLERNKRDVWFVASEPTPEAHFATFPSKLIEPCILAGSRAGDIVLDPFLGSGTVGMVCERLGRRWVGIELKREYLEIARRRTAQMGLMNHHHPNPPSP